MSISAFDNLSSYIEYYKKNGGPSLIPIDIIGDELDITKATVVRMLQDGRLEGIKIGRSLYTSTESYISFVHDEKQRVQKVRLFLEECAKNGEIVTYAPVMEHVGLRWQSPPDRKIIGRILGEISTDTHKEKKIFLTAIVHKKQGSRTIPGNGFFDLVEYITGESPRGDEHTAAMNAANKVFKYYAKHRS
ncbi:MAG: hypothetical protein ABF876_01670 [Acetobacter aceti]|uniref:Uncharacterized protein n=1 Tax=Acetobacter aceti TaxID=435 RepID=A0A1U9KHB3_ACEAC|nr:hypothetical protein [Acetobacter aceti]AQS85146.1 hypothetical protein A0U92_10530 [Acetobacter aceti]